MAQSLVMPQPPAPAQMVPQPVVPTRPRLSIIFHFSFFIGPSNSLHLKLHPNLIPNINKHTRFSGKENNQSLSPNIRTIHSSNKPIQNNLFPTNQIMFNNNNHHYNTKELEKKKK